MKSMFFFLHNKVHLFRLCAILFETFDNIVGKFSLRDIRHAERLG